MEPIQWGQIFQYGIEMSVTLMLAFLLYMLRVRLSPTDTKDWFAANALSLFLSFAVAWLLAFGIVFSPSLSAVIGILGFNASQSAAAMALVIAGFTVSATAEPTS